MLLHDLLCLPKQNNMKNIYRKSSAPRIIFVSSVAHLWGKINFDTLNQPDGSWVPAQFRAYAQSKLANVLLAREIHKREENIKTYVAHPGISKIQ